MAFGAFQKSSQDFIASSASSPHPLHRSIRFWMPATRARPERCGRPRSVGANGFLKNIPDFQRRTRRNKSRCCTGATIDPTKLCLNVALTIINIETADRGSQRVVPSGHETIMLSRLAYAIIGSVVVAASFSGTLFALNWWSGNLSYDPLFTASIPSLPPARPQEPAPSARPMPAATTVATQETPADALPKVQTRGFQWAAMAHLLVR